jgi:hypothetical protein
MKRKIIALAVLFITVTINVHAQQMIIPVAESIHRLSLENFRGTLEINGYEKDEIVISPDGETTPPKLGSDADYKRIGVSVGLKGDQMIIRCLLPIGKTRNYHVKIPVRLMLKITAGCEASGPVNLKNLESEVEVSACRPISVRNSTGALILSSSAGEIKIDHVSVAPTSPVSIITTNGNIRVYLRENTGANLIMDTNSGELYSDYNLPGQNKENNKIAGKHVNFKLGAGGATITLQTLNGNIYLFKDKH